MGSPPLRAYKFHLFTDNTTEAANAGREFRRVNQNLLLLRFHPPYGDKSFPDSKVYDNRANRSFMLRVYIPNEATDKVAILYNGLDETFPQFRSEQDLFMFYDNLGFKLSHSGILAILLATPYHLNRVLTHKSKKALEERRQELSRNGKTYVDKTVPSSAMMCAPRSLYKNQFLAFLELVALVRTLSPLRDQQTFLKIPLSRLPPSFRENSDHLLQSQLKTESKLKISLVGYSMGGLRAMKDFLLDRHLARQENREPLFASCVCINSGGGLQSLPTPNWVPRANWKGMIRELLSERLRLERSRVKQDLPMFLDGAKLHAGFMDDVFLGAGNSLNVIGSSVAEWILFVIGGGDDLVPLRSLSRFSPASGLNVFQVAGMGHILSSDEAWRRWREAILNVVVSFVAQMDGTQAMPDLHSDRFLARLAALLDHEFNLLPYWSDLKNGHTAIDKADEKLNEVASANSRKFLERVIGREASQDLAPESATRLGEELRDFCSGKLHRLQSHIQLGNADKTLYKYERERLLLGRLTAGEGYLHLKKPFKKLSETCHNEGRAFGDAIVKGGFATKEAVEAAANLQRAEFAEISTSVAGAFRRHLKSGGDIRRG